MLVGVVLSLPLGAKGAVTTEILSALAPAGDFGLAVPDCPGDATAIAGGTDVDNVLLMSVTSSSPWFNGNRLINTPDGAAGAPTGWYGAARNNQVSTAGLAVGALCTKDFPVTSVVASSTAFAGSISGAIAMCPLGSVAIAGGVDLDNVLTMTVTADAPYFAGSGRLLATADGSPAAPVGWAGYARNDDVSDHPIKVAAICSSAVSPTVLVQSTTVPSGSFAGVNVTCPLGTNAIGGGVDLNNVFTMKVTSMAPLFPGTSFLLQQPDGDGPAPIGWSGYARSDDVSPQAIKVAAICVPEPDAALAGLAASVALACLGATRRRSR